MVKSIKDLQNFRAQYYLIFILSIQNGKQPLVQTNNQLSYNYYIKQEVIMSDQVSLSTFRIRSVNFHRQYNIIKHNETVGLKAFIGNSIYFIE